MIAKHGEDGYAVIERNWPGACVAILGGGPSITQDQVDQCRGLKTIAVNDAYRLAPWADVLYFADRRWKAWHDNRADFVAFAGQRISIEQRDGVEALLPDKNYYVLRNHSATRNAQALAVKPTEIATGGLSGYQAINIAFLAGAKRILLLGFDLSDDNGKAHWFGEHPIATDVPWMKQQQSKFSKLEWELTRRGIAVLNCSPGTKLESFPCSTLEAALETSAVS